MILSNRINPFLTHIRLNQFIEHSPRTTCFITLTDYNNSFIDSLNTIYASHYIVAFDYNY